MQPVIERYGSGHINETYRVSCPEGPRYILQKLNTSIFTDPDALMANVKRVTEHLAAKGEPTLRVLDYSRPWRTYAYIEGAHTVDVISSPAEAEKAARAFGRFQRLLADLPPPRLNEILPAFHDTRARLAQLDAALKADVKGRAASCATELAFVNARRAEMGRIPEMLERGELPERITHNDTKINNVMLDDATGEGRAVIDLDTVMPGSALYDFGDMVRTATANAAEDERDLAKVYSRPDYFEALVKGYLGEAAGFLTDAEIGLLAFSGRAVTFTIGVRFLTDYLAGDVYFRTASDDHNLVRCRTQFKMVASMEEQRTRYEAVVSSCAAASGRV